VLRRIDDIDPACDRRNGAGCQFAPMGSGIDPPRQPGDDDITCLTEFGRNVFREPAPVRRRVAGADDGDRGRVSTAA
jgi:hypothetical protein